jgi:hypothetical protein
MGEVDGMRRPSIGAGVVAGKVVGGARRLSKNIVDTARRLSGAGLASSGDDDRMDDDDDYGDDDYDDDDDRLLAGQSVRKATSGTVLLAMLLGIVLLATLGMGGRSAVAPVPRRTTPLLAVHHSRLEDTAEAPDEELMQHRNIVSAEFARVAAGHPVPLSCKSSANMHLLGALKEGQSLRISCPEDCEINHVDKKTGGPCTKASASCISTQYEPEFFKRRLWGNKQGYFEESLVCLAAAHAFGELTSGANRKVELDLAIVSRRTFRGGDVYTTLANPSLVSAERLKPGHGFIFADDGAASQKPAASVEQLLEQAQTLWGEIKQPNGPMTMSSEFLKELHAFYEPAEVFRDQTEGEL